MLRGVRACMAVMACLVVGACGDESDSGTASPKADAGKDSGLGVKRFDALDRVYAAALPLDRYQAEKDFSGARFRQETKPLLQACEALPEDDVLMRAMRSGCPLLTEFVQQESDIGACDSIAECKRSMRSFRSFVNRMLAVSRRGDRAVAAEKGLSDGCKRALSTPPQTYSIFAGYESGILLMERALRSPSTAALDKAQQRLDAADKESKTLPSAKLLLERFRSGCD